nr:PREDICTED: calcium-activated potassium channel subunit beta-3 [Lepisosteus oculatus]
MSQPGADMSLQPASRRGSCGVPVQITLQCARRRFTRDMSGSVSVQDPRSRARDGKGTDRCRSQPPVSSAGEDRAVLLGFAMMAFSVLMLFVLGITVVKPYMLSSWSEQANCTVIRMEILEDWVDCTFICGVDCRGQAKYPCLQVFVNLSSSGQKAVLHYNDEVIQQNPKCFYIPKCLRDGDELLSDAKRILRSLHPGRGSPFSCHYSPDKQPRDAILFKKYDSAVVLHCLLWPSLLLVAGALVVAMVKLTQHLSQLAAGLPAAPQKSDSGPPSPGSRRSGQSKLHKLFQGRPRLRQSQHAPLC